MNPSEPTGQQQPEAPKCPKCGSDKIAMFDDNDDHCLKCGSIFSAVISNSNTVAQLRAEVESARFELEKLSKFIWDATPPLNRTQIGNTVDSILNLLKHGKA